MSARNARLLVLAALLAGAAGNPAAAEPAAETAPAEGHRERPDDPPVPPAKRALTLAPSSVVSRGNHVSVQVNTGPAGANILGDAANEPTMAIDPTAPGNIVIGWRQFDSVASNFRQAGYAFSHDGGASWTFPGVLQPGQFRSDPVLAAANDGKFYYYSLSTVNSAEMFISSDKGETWLGPFPGFGGDKEWMTVDVSASVGAGNVHALWNSQFTCCAPGTDYTRSIDGGFAYQGPYAMPVKVKWGTLDAGPDGTLWVVGSDLFTSASPAHYVLRSTNAYHRGQVPFFEYAQGIDLGGTTVAGGTPNPGGLLGQVWIAADRTEGGAFRGYVYVLGSVDPPGADPLDVKLIASADRGVTWTTPRRVNDEPPGGGAYQWFGAMSVAPGGRIDATWYDTRSNPTGTISEVYYAYSTDAGATWSSGLPVSPPFNSLIGWPNQNKIGDYTHMVSDATGAALAYAATFNGEQDVWFVRVGDCNGNGVHDSIDIDNGTSPDCNGSGHPDSCEDLHEICSGGADDDCDGVADCMDPDCAVACGCDFDGVCEVSEDCRTCPSDCPIVPARCGDGVCNADAGESCLSCPADCAGVQQGNPGSQFCCGSGQSGATNPVACTDPRCNQNGFACRKVVAPCCGDLSCESGETPCACAVDCGASTAQEGACSDGIDNDCDATTDCSDTDCATPLPAPPAGAPVLQAERTAAGGVRLVWSRPPGAISYDVAAGDLELLAGGNGLGVSTIGCLADDIVEVELETQPGEGQRWFLVRPRSCAAVGSYDDGTTGQAAPRDATIGAAGGCP